MPIPAASREAGTIGALICTYQRPEPLARCLEGLRLQTRPPDEVVVIARTEDAATIEMLDRVSLAPIPLRVILVDQPGMVHALNSGLDAWRCDVAAIADDDTVAAPDWIERILAHFAADPALGALGGRDRCHDGVAFDDRRADPVGRVQWFGRLIGNHHLGHGAARPVDWLKGANISVRAEAVADLRFDPRMRGKGSQPANDIGFSLAIRRSGWRVVYDPAVTLDHYAGATRAEPRHYVDKGRLADDGGYYDLCFNNALVMSDHLGSGRRTIHAVWSILIGTGVQPGLLQAFRTTPRLGTNAWRRFLTAQRALFAARRVARDGRRRPASRLPSQAGHVAAEHA